MMRVGMAPALVLVVLASVARAQGMWAEREALAAAQRAVLAKVNTPANTPGDAQDGESRLRPLDSKGMEALLEQSWGLAGRWAAGWLEEHPAATKEELGRILDDFSPPPPKIEVYDPKIPDRYALSGSATRIAPDTYVLSVTYGELQGSDGVSSFAVVGRGAQGRYTVLWSIGPLAKRHYASRDEIGMWAFRGSCAYYCGSLMVQAVVPLPETKDGRPRFAVEAVQATNGSTGLYQYSIWRWDGQRASSLFAHSYADYLDDGRGVAIAGDLITLPTKEWTRAFGVYGCCAEPRGVWRVRLTEEGARDLGHRLLQPEVGWADLLLRAIRKPAPAGEELASASVLRKLRRSELEIDSLAQCRVHRAGEKGSFTIEFGAGGKVWLAYERRAGRVYFTAVKVDGE
jgi:hypothetical protein